MPAFCFYIYFSYIFYIIIYETKSCLKNKFSCDTMKKKKGRDYVEKDYILALNYCKFCWNYFHNLLCNNTKRFVDIKHLWRFLDFTVSFKLHFCNDGKEKNGILVSVVFPDSNGR